MISMDALITLKIGPTNCYLLKSEDGRLLIDTSLPTCFRQFIRELRTVRIDLSEIRCLLLTHSHDDHAGFAAEVKDKASCKMIVHENATEALKNGCNKNVGRYLNKPASVFMSLYSWVKRRSWEYSPVTFDDDDIIVADHDDDVLKTLGIGGRILYTPGHTDDSLSVLLANGDAFVGDACMNIVSLLHYRPVAMHNSDRVFESWRKIIESGAKTIYPAHGKPFAVEGLIRSMERYAPARTNK